MRIPGTSNMLRVLMVATFTLALIGADALLAYKFASSRPTVKDGTVDPPMHQWDVGSFWLPLLGLGGLALVFAAMLWVSHHRSGHMRGAVIGSFVVAACAIGLKQLWPADVSMMSAAYGVAVGFLILVAYAVLIGGGVVAKKLHLFG